jgi:Protein of unknown function (DUF1302)
VISREKMTKNNGLLFASSLLALSVSTLSVPAAGQTFSSGELSGYINLEMSYGLRVRMEDFDPSIIGPTNIEGGSFHLNADDGNLNYEQHDVVANVFSIKPELAMKWRNFGFFASGYAFYDFENSDGSRPHVPLSDETKKDVAHDADFREAYISMRFLANDMPTRLRVGKQVLNWGQANFFQGIKSLNPVNIPQLQMPGGGLDDLHRGQDMVWGLIALTPLVSVEGFYQYDWEPTELSSSGSYLSTYDNLEGVRSYGGRNSFLSGNSNDTGAAETLATLGLDVSLAECEAMNRGQGPRTFSCLTEAFTAVPSARTRDPEDKSGDWGLTLRTVIPQLNDTELAFHHAQYTSHIPLIGVRLGDFPELAELGFTDPQFGTPMPVPYTPDGIDSITRELIANQLCSPSECNSATTLLGLHWPLRTAETQPYYPDDRIKMYGLSWATTTIKTGTALAGELVHKQDLPLQIHSGEILWAAANPTVSSPECNVGPTVSIGPIPVRCAPRELREAPIDPLIKQLDSSQLTLSATQLFPSGFLGSDLWTLGLEASWIHLHSMPDAAPDITHCLSRPDQRPGRDEIATLTVPGTRIFECDSEQSIFLTDDAWGLRFYGAATWSGVFGELSLTPNFVYKTDIEGYSPYGTIIEDREELSVGISASFLRSASVGLSYHAFWGAGSNNLLRDRDYMDLVVKYEF